MEKQVHSNQEEKAQNFQGKFNKITTFLAKFIFQNNFEILKKSGFVDSYTSDPEIMSILELHQNQRLLYLLFKNKKLKLEDLKKIVTSLVQIPVNIVFSYELVNDYSMIVLEFPKEYVQDYDLVVKGVYSRLSDEFKNKFPMSRDVFNAKNIRVGKEYTLYHHIFNKTEWLKQFWKDRLGLFELDEKLELWEQPDNDDLIFNVNSIV